MPLSPLELAKKAGNLASLPEVCIKLNEVISRPNSAVADVVAIIETDPAVAARLLRVANSSYYGMQGGVDSINRAVMLLGTNVVRDLVWMTSSINSLSQFNKGYEDIEAFWKHSLYSAVCARVLAVKCKLLNKDRIFLSALLHDIGRLVMHHLLPEEMQVVKLRLETSQEHVASTERQILGFDHAQIGEALLQQWGLPPSVVTAIKMHHRPEKASAYAMESAIVHIADQVAKQAGYSSYPGNEKVEVNPSAWSITGLSERIIESVVKVSDDDFNELVALYLQPMGIAA